MRTKSGYISRCPTLHVRDRVGGVGAVLVVGTLHPGTGMAPAAPTVVRHRPPIIEESGVDHLVRQPVLVVPAEPSAVAGDDIGSSEHWHSPVGCQLV